MNGTHARSPRASAVECMRGSDWRACVSCWNRISLRRLCAVCVCVCVYSTIIYVCAMCLVCCAHMLARASIQRFIHKSANRLARFGYLFLGIFRAVIFFYCGWWFACAAVAEYRRAYISTRICARLRAILQNESSLSS